MAARNLCEHFQAVSDRLHEYIYKNRSGIMKKICGFAMFWIAVGMVIMFFIETTWIAVAIITVLLLCGYHLFCC